MHKLRLLTIAMLVLPGIGCISAVAQEEGGGRHLQLPPGATLTMVAATQADPTLKTEYDNPSIVVLPKNPRPELVVFLPGSHGSPQAASNLFGVLTAGGYRSISLMYEDVPSEADACKENNPDPSGPDPQCSRLFREERIFGDAPDAAVQNTVQQSIDYRLVKLLQYLDKQQPSKGWGQYLNGDQPAWSKIIITGHSQGAGHAAYIAKKFKVARVVLFSGPADFVGEKGKEHAADWVTEPNKTPAADWYGFYHEKERGAQAFVFTYPALGLTADHTYIEHLEPTSTNKAAYHTAGPSDIRYAPQWRAFFGIEPVK